MFARVISELRECNRSIDPSLVSAHEAATLLDEITEIERLTVGLKMLVTARAASSGRWRRDGARDEADWLARKSGTTKARAAETLRASEALATLPALDAAVRSGRLSSEQAATVADAAIADPASEARMVALAKRESVRRLREERDRVKAAACPDPDERHRRIHASRYMRFGTGADGAGTGSWRVTPEIQAELRARLTPFMKRVFDDAREAGRREPSEAYAADALMEMARAASGTESLPGTKPRHTVPTKVIVRIDWDALIRGRTDAGETCDIGGMPVPVSVVQDLITSGNPFLTAVLTRGSDIVRVVHLGRGPNAQQRTALEWRHTGCARVSCSGGVDEYDHREPFAKVKVTTLDNLWGLCGFDHDLKSHKGFRMVDADIPGKIDLIAPADAEGHTDFVDTG